MRKVSIAVALVATLGAGGGLVAHAAKAVGGSGAARATRAAFDDAKDIQGEWVVTSTTVNGEKSDLAEGLTYSNWNFKGDKIEIEITGVPKSTATFKLNTVTNPKTMTVKAAEGDQNARGIDFVAVYSVEPGKLRLAFVGGSTTPPAGFDAAPPQGQQMFVMEMVPEDKAPKPGAEQLKRGESARTKARTAAARAISVNNLKQIAIAFHVAADVKSELPSDIKGAEGKPLLSWRVAILPYIEQQELYKQFHLDEAWDSPHNKALIAKMPRIYTPVGDAVKAEPGTTFYQVFTGGGAMFDSDKPTRFPDIRDGTSNTIMVVEGGSAVPWTKPEDITFDADKELPKFGGMKLGDGFNAAFGDGVVKFLKDTVSEKVLKALITRAGGEALNGE